MVKYILYSTLAILISFSCKTPQVNVPQEVSKCDTYGKLLLTNPGQYTVEFFDLNSEMQIPTTNRENQSAYEFKFLGNQIFDQYDLVFQAMRPDGSIIEPFVVELKITDRFSLSVNGDRLFSAYVKLDDLANKIKYPNGYNNVSIHDLVYSSSWKISIRGKVCGYLGPKSEPVLIVLKC